MRLLTTLLFTLVSPALASGASCSDHLEDNALYSLQKRFFEPWDASRLDAAVTFYGPELVTKLTRLRDRLLRRVGDSLVFGNHRVTFSVRSRSNGEEDDLEELKKEFAFIIRTGDIEDFGAVQRSVSLGSWVRYLEKIDRLCASNRFVCEVAEYLNDAFQNPEVIVDFVMEVVLKSFVLSAEVGTDGEQEHFRDWLNGVEQGLDQVFSEKVILDLVRPLGWTGFVDVERGQDIFRDGFSKRKLARDQIYRKKRHTGDGHWFQVALASLLYEKHIADLFGRERLFEFFDVLMSPEGEGLWVLLFDRGPGEPRDLRWPHFLKEKGIFTLLELS